MGYAGLLRGDLWNTRLVKRAVRGRPAPSEKSGMEAIPTESEQQPPELLSEGRRLMQEGDYEGAVAYFDWVMALDPEPFILASAHLNRLDALRKLGREQDAQDAEANWESVKQAAIERSATDIERRDPQSGLANEPTAPPKRTPEKRHTLICLACGGKNRSDGRFCVSCGAPLRGDTGSNPGRRDLTAEPAMPGYSPGGVHEDLPDGEAGVAHWTIRPELGIYFDLALLVSTALFAALVIVSIKFMYANSSCDGGNPLDVMLFPAFLMLGLSVALHISSASKRKGWLTYGGVALLVVALSATWFYNLIVTFPFLCGMDYFPQP